MTQDEFLMCAAAWLLIGFFGMLTLLPNLTEEDERALRGQEDGKDDNDGSL